VLQRAHFVDDAPEDAAQSRIGRHCALNIAQHFLLALRLVYRHFAFLLDAANVFDNAVRSIVPEAAGRAR
jgi:hypothetical protein